MPETDLGCKGGTQIVILNRQEVMEAVDKAFARFTEEKDRWQAAMLELLRLPPVSKVVRKHRKYLRIVSTKSGYRLKLASGCWWNRKYVYPSTAREGLRRAAPELDSFAYSLYEMARGAREMVVFCDVIFLLSPPTSPVVGSEESCF